MSLAFKLQLSKMLFPLWSLLSSQPPKHPTPSTRLHQIFPLKFLISLCTFFRKHRAVCYYRILCVIIQAIIQGMPVSPVKLSASGKVKDWVLCLLLTTKAYHGSRVIVSTKFQVIEWFCMTE